MRLRLDLVLCAALVGTAGSELVALGSPYAAERAEQVCRPTGNAGETARFEAERRIVAEGYTNVRILTKDCEDAWHALALADGDPVNLRVTAQGSVSIE